MQAGSGPKEEIEGISNRLHAEQRAWSPEPEIKNWAKIKSWILNALSHPGAPYLTNLKSKIQMDKTTSK